MPWPPSPYIQLVKDNEAEIRRLIEDGTPYAQIGAKFGVNGCTVRAWRDKLGAKRPEKRAPRGSVAILMERRSEIEKWLSDGLSFGEVAKKLGLGKQLVRNYRRHGLRSQWPATNKPPLIRVLRRVSHDAGSQP